MHVQERAQDTIREMKQQQLNATDMMATLLNAPDVQHTARAYVDSLDEQFFWSANAYMAMVCISAGSMYVVWKLQTAMCFQVSSSTILQPLPITLCVCGAYLKSQSLTLPGSKTAIVADSHSRGPPCIVQPQEASTKAPAMAAKPYSTICPHACCVG